MRGARWAEIDHKARVWTNPATRMKAKREHRVPLSGRAVEILQAVSKLGDGRSRLAFPSREDKPHLTDPKQTGCNLSSAV